MKESGKGVPTPWLFRQADSDQMGGYLDAGSHNVPLPARPLHTEGKAIAAANVSYVPRVIV
jgi:hypothetical protein